MMTTYNITGDEKVDNLVSAAAAAWHALRSYQYGNSAPTLAEQTADALAAALKAFEGHSGPPLIKPGEPTLALLEDAPRRTQVAWMKEWCKENYEGGSSTMVECWEEQAYYNLFVDGEETLTFAEAFELLYRVASVYRDQEADARYYRLEARGEL